MPDVTLRGGDDVADLMRRLRLHADSKAIKRELYAGLNRETKSLRLKMKSETGSPPVLPTANGLQRLVQGRQSVTATVKGGKHAGISIRVKGLKGGADIASIHRTGRVRHPVFGNRNVWVTQSEGVKAKWMEPVFDGSKPELVRAIGRVLDDIARKVEGY